MKKQTFEQALKRLDEIVELIDNGEISLDQSLNCWKKALDWWLFVRKNFNQVEKRIQILRKDNEGFVLDNEELT
jgi:exodeoxyribonuclease VII small subunit